MATDSLHSSEVQVIALWAAVVGTYFAAGEYHRVSAERAELLRQNPELPDLPRLPLRRRRWFMRSLMWIGLVGMPAFAAAAIYQAI